MNQTKREYKNIQKYILDLNLFENLSKDEISMEDILSVTDTYQDFRICIILPLFRDPAERLREGSSYEFNKDPKLDKTIFIYYDLKAKHYKSIRAPAEFLRVSRHNRSIEFCNECCWYYNKNHTSLQKCGCLNEDGTSKEVKKNKSPKRKQCEVCGTDYAAYTKHKCYHTECQFCKSFYKKGLPHRCPLYTYEKTFYKSFIGDEEGSDEINIDKDLINEKNQYCLYVYDIESKLHLVEDKKDFDFERDIDGNFILENNEVKTLTIQKSQQVPNFVCYENVFTNELTKTNSLKEMIEFALTSNEGYNIFLAHNGSGYDTRLIYEEAIKIAGKGTEIKPIMNGGKFMRLSIGKTIFQDTMLHLKGSLSSLAQGFKLTIEKGHFPHLFNRDENYNYIGSIPSKDYFDISFMTNYYNKDGYKNIKAISEFDEWYDTWKDRTDWNFKNELEKYCINDVKILSQIVFLYHKKSISLISENYPHLAISPWYFPTTAGYVHKMFIRNLHEDSPKPLKDYTHEEMNEYASSTWCALQANEYYFCRKALRGGRTDILQYYYKGKYHYKDIQSHYPETNLKHEYPVGPPTINVFDLDYFPCNFHFDFSKDACNCSIEKKRKHVDYNLKVNSNFLSDTNLHEYIKDFFGIIMVDVTPPTDLYHPVLVYYDESKQKCIASLEPMEKAIVTSVELNRAIEMGYTVTKIYRADRYDKAPSLWRGLLGSMYKAKMRYSSKTPSPEDQIRIAKYYKENYNMIIDDFDRWEKNGVLKLCAKQPVTCAWGKHAETVDHAQSLILDDSMTGQGYEFYQSTLINKNTIQDIINLPNNKTIFKYKISRNKQRPNTHRGYLPIAVFTTSYARLKLWEELNKLGKRVIMYDTDSIVYAHEEGGYDIKEGDCIGDWETEDYEKDNKGLSEFVALGPKSYALKCFNGNTTIKTKGVSIKMAHENLISFDIYKKLLDNPASHIEIPQFSIDYEMGEGMFSRHFLKRIQFNEEFVKGQYVASEYRAYPNGWKFL